MSQSKPPLSRNAKPDTAFCPHETRAIADAEANLARWVDVWRGEGKERREVGFGAETELCLSADLRAWQTQNIFDSRSMDSSRKKGRGRLRTKAGIVQYVHSPGGGSDGAGEGNAGCAIDKLCTASESLSA